MKARHINVDESSNALFAVIDARQRNIVNAKLWGHSAKDEAGRFAEAVRQAYGRSRVFLNYRQKFIAIKVELPHRYDMVSQQAAAVDTYADMQGYAKVTTNTAIIFRIAA